MNEPTNTPSSNLKKAAANVDAIEAGSRASTTKETAETIKNKSDDIYRKSLKPNEILERMKGQHDDLAAKSATEIDNLIVENELKLQIIRDANAKIQSNNLLIAKHKGIIDASNAFISEAKKHE